MVFILEFEFVLVHNPSRPLPLTTTTIRLLYKVSWFTWKLLTHYFPFMYFNENVTNNWKFNGSTTQYRVSYFLTVICSRILISFFFYIDSVSPNNLKFSVQLYLYKNFKIMSPWFLFKFTFSCNRTRMNFGCLKRFINRFLRKIVGQIYHLYLAFRTFFHYFLRKGGSH